MTPTDAFVDAVEGGLLPKSGRLLLAVSGGLDSVVMAHAASLAPYDWTLIIATVDHGLHRVSAEHAQFVERLAKQLHIEFVGLVADQEQMDGGEGPEDGARRERYRLLEQAAEDHGAVAMLTAHTADDQAETLLMRLAQGGGLAALRGIPAVRGHIIRPLLGFTRVDLLRWATSRDLVWVDDPTNEVDRFLRNSVRQTVKPAMESVFGGSWVQCAARSARNLADVEAVVNGLLDSVFSEGVVWEGRTVSVSTQALESCSVSMQRLFWARLMSDDARARFSDFARPSKDHIDALVSLLGSGHQGQKRDVGAGWYAVLEGDSITLNRTGAPSTTVAPLEPIEIRGPGEYIFGDWVLSVGNPVVFDACDDAHVLPVELAPFPWVVRSVTSGERFRPLGAPGSKRVSKLWIDAKFPSSRRQGAPAIEVGGRLAWVTGLRISDHIVSVPGNMVTPITCSRVQRDS